MPYELKSEKFSGPLEKLLELIEDRKFEITEINLAQVTDDFLRYLKGLAESGEPNLRLVADFIAVASRLILIKSKWLLPGLELTQEEESGIKDLERRLKAYQEFKPTLKIIAGLWQGKKKEFGRPYFLERGFTPGGSGTSIFYPGEDLSLDLMVSSIRGIFESFEKYQLETQTIKDKIISLEEKIREIVKRLESEEETNLSRLSKTKSKQEIIVVFLALLHLAREQLIFLEQAHNFADITVKKMERQTRQR